MMEWMWAVGDLVGWLPLLAPAMIGAFWGAPLLAREFEHGTDQLTWTQSVTRRRWLIAKVGGLGAAVTLGGLALGGIVYAWLAVFDSSAFPVNFFNTNWFRLVGIGPAAWWLSGVRARRGRGRADQADAAGDGGDPGGVRAGVLRAPLGPAPLRDA
ncbi:hypothetical protein [Nonomuraea dietziae]|uniref:hypothetical protein n=1 Tax=Nonomuraea dietziae TaxID=65515 RepID=UPI0033CFB0CA